MGVAFSWCINYDIKRENETKVLTQSVCGYLLYSFVNTQTSLSFWKIAVLITEKKVHLQH